MRYDHAVMRVLIVDYRIQTSLITCYLWHRLKEFIFCLTPSSHRGRHQKMSKDKKDAKKNDHRIRRKFHFASKRHGFLVAQLLSLSTTRVWCGFNCCRLELQLSYRNDIIFSCLCRSKCDFEMNRKRKCACRHWMGMGQHEIGDGWLKGL